MGVWRLRASSSTTGENTTIHSRKAVYGTEWGLSGKVGGSVGLTVA